MGQKKVSKKHGHATRTTMARDEREQETEEPESAYECGQSVSEYVEAQKEAFVFRIPSLEGIL